MTKKRNSYHCFELMNTIEKIRAEIERLYNDKSYSEDRWDMGYDCACEDILSFLDTLEEEHLADERKMIEPEKKEGRTDCSPQGEVPNDSLATQSYEKIPKDLEEAAVDIADELLAKPKDYILSAKADYWNGAHDGIIAGAKWGIKSQEKKIADAYEKGKQEGIRVVRSWESSPGQGGY